MKFREIFESVLEDKIVLKVDVSENIWRDYFVGITVEQNSYRVHNKYIKDFRSLDFALKNLKKWLHNNTKQGNYKWIDNVKFNNNYINDLQKKEFLSDYSF